MLLLATYAVYIAISLAITIWVGRTLNKNGRVFLIENFQGQEQLADSINHLLLVGFYLVNVGFMSLALRYGEKPADAVGAVEFLSTKIGLVVVVLGFMHFFNMNMLVKFRHSKLFKALGPNPEEKATVIPNAAETDPRPWSQRPNAMWMSTGPGL